ncbi:MAG: 30S ribosomal protein S20 [Candidatus Omnitrophica bacterium]|nr:30S ribosomal protein S20 [Candidatus Omnitrophota bacterium]
MDLFVDIFFTICYKFTTMPIKKASFKSVRKDKKRHLRNLRVSSELRTLDKKFEALIAANKLSDAKQLLPLLISHIGRLTKRLAKLERGQSK